MPISASVAKICSIFEGGHLGFLRSKVIADFEIGDNFAMKADI